MARASLCMSVENASMADSSTPCASAVPAAARSAASFGPIGSPIAAAFVIHASAGWPSAT